MKMKMKIWLRGKKMNLGILMKIKENLGWSHIFITWLNKHSGRVSIAGIGGKIENGFYLRSVGTPTESRNFQKSWKITKWDKIKYN